MILMSKIENKIVLLSLYDVMQQLRKLALRRRILSFEWQDGNEILVTVYYIFVLPIYISKGKDIAFFLKYLILLYK